MSDSLRAQPKFIAALNYPRRFLIAAILILAASAWLYMGFMALLMSETTSFSSMGPGMAFLDTLRSSLQPEVVMAVNDFLDHGESAHAHLMPGALGYWSFKDVFLTFLMWQVMAIGMMLPTATPTILAFHDISGNDVQGKALKKRDALFVFGYLNLWAIFSLLATGLVWLLRSLALLSPELVSLNTYLSAAVLLLAGIYQFSPLKEHCLTKCRNPMTFFFSSWRSGDNGALAMGAHHAVYCLGCCWALMLVMIVVGSMNLIWMAILGIIMLLEKVIPKGGKLLAYSTGAASCVIALLLVIRTLG